jgi:Tol biopolymer transport system component
MQVISHDTLTGTEIVRLTSERSVQHHLTGPSVTSDGRWLAFITHETGWPNLAAMDLGSGDVRILTLRRDLNAASATLTIDGLAVLFSARDAVWAVTIADGNETKLAGFSGAVGRGVHRRRDLAQAGRDRPIRR